MLFGGRSAEHDVSRVSALHVLRAVDLARYDVVPVGIDRTGQWFLCDHALQEARDTPDQKDLTIHGLPVTPSEVLRPAGAASSTVVFPVLHGPYGEDGAMQGLLESLRVPYVGAGVLGSAVSMDKAAAKTLVAAAGIPQCRWLHFGATDDRADLCATAEAELGFPLFVKPANQGSSIGISKARTPAELRTSVDLAFRYDDVIVLEEAVIGREIELGVLGNSSQDQELRVTQPGEILIGADFYDYADKYESSASSLEIPAQLSATEVADVQRLALATYRTLRGDGLARVDFFYESPGRGWLLNEMNTMPGFTPISMYPKLWDHEGLDYTSLIDTLVALALDRHAET